MKPFGYLLFIIIISICCNSVASATCQEDLGTIYHELFQIGNIHDYKSTISNITKNFLVYSGRFINDFGEYQFCQKQNYAHYLTLRFTAKLPETSTSMSVLLGFCAPQSCSLIDSERNISGILKLYELGMKLPIEAVLQPKNISFYDPSTPNIKDSFSTVVIFIILVTLIFLIMLGTLMNLIFEGNDKPKAMNQITKRLLDETHIKQQFKTYQGISKFLNCFDARKNFQKLIQVKYHDSYDHNLEIFNGIRVIMFAWIVYGHHYVVGPQYADNILDFPEMRKDSWLLIPFASSFAVDVFFYMSGFLFAFLAISKLARMQLSFKSYSHLAFHRLFRIWPSYFIALIFYWKILPILGDGPIWFQLTDQTSLCDNGKILNNILLIDNFLVESANYCYGWGWYLSNDFQMFLITSLLLWMYIRNKKKAKIVISLLICSSLTFAWIYGYHLGVRANPPTTGGIANPKTFSLYYVKPYIRLPPYFIGVLMGLFYSEFKQQEGLAYNIGKLIIKKAVRGFSQLIGWGLILFLIFHVREVQIDPTNWSDFYHATWRAFQSSLFVIALTLIILPGLLGEDTIIKRFLSHPFLVPLARITFTAYLVHLFWVMRSFYGATTAYHFTHENIMYSAISNILMSFITAGALSLLAEIPFANIENLYILKKEKSHGNIVVNEEAHSLKKKERST